MVRRFTLPGDETKIITRILIFSLADEYLKCDLPFLPFVDSKISISRNNRSRNFRERQPEGPLHEDDGEGGGGAAAGRRFPRHAEGARLGRRFRRGWRRGRGQEFEVVGTGPVRPVPGFPRPRAVRPPFRQRGVLRDLSEREPRHRKRRCPLQGSPARQKGPSSEGEDL